MALARGIILPVSCIRTGSHTQPALETLSTFARPRKHQKRLLVQAQPNASVHSTQTLEPLPVVLPEQPGTQAEISTNGAPKPRLASLLIQCPDQKGVVAALAQLLYGFGCNILESDQYTDTSTAVYFQRIRFDYSECVVSPSNTQVLEHAIAELAKRYQMDWRLYYDSKVKKVAILVSKLDHCLYDLLIRLKAGELNCQVPIIISNHPDLAPIAEQFGVAFRYEARTGFQTHGSHPILTDLINWLPCKTAHALQRVWHLPLPQADAQSKQQQEQAIEQLLQQLDIDLLVLASFEVAVQCLRYMQIFSSDFCARHADHTVNIHHSFLPAFEGAKPYHKAHKRGVKIIGATAHFATADLDAGPIIEQDVTRITHRDSVKDMLRKGRDLERLVLARAVRWVLEDRVLVHGNKTVVFD